MNQEHKKDLKKYRKTLNEVFDSLWFDSYEMKTILRKSYFMNLDQIIDYARENGIDEMAHLMQIQQILLGSSHVRLKHEY